MDLPRMRSHLHRKLFDRNMTAIVTPRLMLTKHTDQQNLKAMVRWLNDSEVVHFSEQRHLKHDQESQAHYIANGPSVFREIHIGIKDKFFVGTIAAYIDRSNSVANVGILIGEKEEWGKGYGTEAWAAFCNHLLTHGVRKIEAGTMSCNYGMVNIFRRTGMHYEGCLAEHFMLGDKLYALVQWARYI
jgi:ribosomal-protein-alanine N-acetyltransferase